MSRPCCGIRCGVHVLVALALLFAGGCRSSKKVVNHGGSYTEVRKQAEQERKRIVHESSDALVREAEQWLGTPYRYGGSEKGVGTDCSGLTMEVYRRVTGIKIPRNSAEQQRFCVPLKRDNLRAGDLVFFSSAKGRGGVSHVGIYVDEGVFVHASSSRGVIASNLSENYYDSHFHSAGRVPGVEHKKGKAKPSPKSQNAKLDVKPGKPKSDPAKPKETILRPSIAPVIADSIPVESDTIRPVIVMPMVPDSVSATPVAPAPSAPEVKASPIEVPVQAPDTQQVESDSIRARVRMAF